MLDDALAAVGSAQAERQQVIARSVRAGLVRHMGVPVREVVGVDQSLQQVRVVEELLGGVAADPPAGRRYVAELAVGAQPVVPVRAEIGQHAVGLLALLQAIVSGL